ncbi:hypothetical protein FACS1894170_06310 [Planctomycetales bacterium]|nr:hypothetical protein FACS1894170_06310 [Planctomycetales bacterium]
MATRYKVTLTTEERQTLDDIVSKGKHSVAKIKHANIIRTGLQKWLDFWMNIFLMQKSGGTKI